MSKAPVVLVLAMALLPSGSAQDAPARQQQNDSPQPPAPNRFLDAWMSEMLYGDHAKARSTYLEVMKAKDLPYAQSELAILRLWETTWQARDRAFYRAELEKLGPVRRETRTWDNETMARFSLGFAEAHAQRDDAQLATLRAAVAEYVRSTPAFRSRRQLVHGALADDVLQPAVGPDPILADLKQALNEARAKGERRRAANLRSRIERHTSPRAQQDYRIRVDSWRLFRKRLADTTRLHLDGEHRFGDALESTLNGRARVRSPLPKYDAFVTAIGLEKWDEKTRRTRLDGVIRRLGDRSRTMLYSTAPERTALKGLRAKLTELRTANQIEQALRLAARTPYRQELFRRP